MNCLDGEQCNNVNGTCETGCAAGWQGDMCNTGKGRLSQMVLVRLVILLILLAGRDIQSTNCVNGT